MENNMDYNFYNEFRDMMNGRRGFNVTKGYRLMDLPLPSLNSFFKGTPKNKLALVRGIREEFFELLNNEEVQLLGKTELKKRQVLSDGSFRLDDNGKYMYNVVHVKRDSVAILSSRSIGLKRFKEENGVRREHKPSDGFTYVDYVEQNKSRRYIYTIPKDYVYKLNLCALILTPNKHRTFYKGYKLALQNGTYLYMYVIPYSYRDNMSYRIVGVKSDFKFDVEVNAIIKHWMSLGVIFNLNITSLDGNINGLTNLGLETFEGPCSPEDFIRYDLSLKDEKDIEII